MKNWEIIETAIDLGSRCDVSSWVDLKKMLLLSLPPKERMKFSTRDPITKQQSLNSLEREIVDNYEKKTGVTLEIPR
jgi:hypothetical protein